MPNTNNSRWAHSLMYLFSVTLFIMFASGIPPQTATAMSAKQIGPPVSLVSTVPPKTPQVDIRLIEENEKLAEKNEQLEADLKRARRNLRKLRASMETERNHGPLRLLESTESKRIGCKIQIPFTESYFSTIQSIESRGRYFAKNSKSSAQGFYQFLDGSHLDTARFGLRYQQKYWSRKLPETQAIVDGVDFFESEDHMKMMVIWHALAKGAKKETLRDAFCYGKRKAAEKLYAEDHHTKIDDATKTLMRRAFDDLWPSSEDIAMVLSKGDTPSGSSKASDS